MFWNGLRLNGSQETEEVIKKANERFERISSATNDAIFELILAAVKAGITRYRMII
jgi:hypothetical protein